MTTDDIRVLKTGTCPSLSGRTKLTYEVGGDPGSHISLRITKTAGTGLRFLESFKATQPSSGEPVRASRLSRSYL